MTDRFDLSRRKLLGAMGTIGGAAALGGAGTMAFFSDTEEFTNNSLTAGELDLKVDWEEHYSDWMGDETQYAEMPTVEDPGPADVDYYLPAPTSNPDSRPIALNFTGGVDTEESQDLFWDATSIEALPDDGSGGGTADDGIQDAVVDPCNENGNSNLVDVGENDNGLGSSLRTDNDDTFDDEGEPLPLVNLSDVKPGDFGEVTFSFHLCTNPGYVWMNGDLVEAAENGLTEPESKDPQETGDADEETTDLDNDVEILDEIQTRFWYDDNCDNQIAQDEEIDVMVVIDESISIEDEEVTLLQQGVNDFIGALPGSVEFNSLNFEGDRIFSIPDKLVSPGGAGAVSVEGEDGNTPLPQAMDVADQVLMNEGRDDAKDVLVVFTDGGPNYKDADDIALEGPGAGDVQIPRNENFTLDPDSPGYDEANQASNVGGGISDGELRETAAIAEQIRARGTRIITVEVITPDPVDSANPGFDGGKYLQSHIASSQAYAKDVEVDDLAAVANDLAATTMNEDLFFEGPLRDALTALSTDKGIPLDGDTSTQYNEFKGDTSGIDIKVDDPDTSASDIDGDGDNEFEPTDSDANRDPFAGEGTTHCVGFEWWLPVDHANQIQGDSVSFDVGFYTEQARHNDGAGQDA